ncbi:unnamed protein product [Oikopleura dioica]|uniref:Uncharacterized protein n=1 Tax=Oikopleura dioica TaxID=34765 RepID=E4Y287_OIKDI|nr:unnamed protein product [Oikopleura dioica]
MGKEVTKPVKKEFKRKPDFKKNKFSKKREEERPSQFSKTAAERRKEIGEKARDRKRAAKAKQEAEKQEKLNEREERDRIMKMRTKKGQPVLSARIGLMLKDMQKNPDLYKTESNI